MFSQAAGPVLGGVYILPDGRIPASKWVYLGAADLVRNPPVY